VAGLNTRATGATAAQQRNKSTVANTPLQQPCNSALATARNSLATAMQQGATAVQQQQRNKRNSPLRGGETVAPSTSRPRAHPRTPGQTPSRLRLRGFRPDHRSLADHALARTSGGVTNEGTDELAQGCEDRIDLNRCLNALINGKQPSGSAARVIWRAFHPARCQGSQNSNAHR
jgi:hypothetical protein